MTMTGTITAQMVIRNRPGTISRNNPIEIAIAARIDAPATGPRYGRAADTVSLMDMSARPSRTSCTALTSVACSRKAATTDTTKPSPKPTLPVSARSAAMTAAIR